MPAAGTRRHLTALIAALALTGAAVTANATFVAPAPGAELEPVPGAESLVSMVQDGRSIVWTALSGSVTWYRLEGWPARTGGSELGGAVVIERPADGHTGIVELVADPKSISFELVAQAGLTER